MSFKELAEDFLNQHILVLNESGTSSRTEFRLVEIEFYLFSETHPDPYTHRAQEQSTSNRFYFHKFRNGTYKSGTWKGLDICLGNENSFFGVLIRSIAEIGAADRIVEGPCLSVNRILGHFGSNDVRNFVGEVLRGKLDFDVYDESQPIHLEKSQDLKREAIFSGPRIGLSDKWPEFKSRPYRFCIFRDRIKKNRKSLNPA